jgi:hypothetical protein
MHPNTRNGWLVGFGIGGGSAGIEASGASSDREAGIAGSFRAGYVIKPQFSLELDSNGWSKEVDGTTVTFSVTSAAVNYYPGNSGLLLRGGVGVGSGKASIQSGSTTVSSTETGFGFLVGAGYELRVMRTFAITPQVEYGWLTTDPFDANYVNGGLGFTWYFLPGQ